MAALILLAVTFLLMWVLFILPQQRRLKAHAALVARLEIGDEVMTTSGVYGTVAELDGDVAHVEVAPGVVLRLARGAIARRLAEDAPATAADPVAEGSRSPLEERPAGTAADRAEDR